MKTIKTVVVVLAAAVAAAYAACWFARFTDGEMRTLRSESSSRVRKAIKSAPDSVLPELRKFGSEEVWRVRLDGTTRWLPRFSRELKVPADVTAGLLEDAFVRFVGNGFLGDDGKARVKGLIAFAEEFIGKCPKGEVNYIRERMLDALFVVDDFDGAVKVIEGGFPGKSANWCRYTVAKIRAHQAEAKGDDAEALRQFLAFGEALAAEPDNGVPEYDPSSGVAYSRSWILGKNAKRCADYCAKLGKGEESARKLAEAKALYLKAVEETKDDEKSLAVLKDEMAKNGISAGTTAPDASDAQAR